MAEICSQTRRWKGAGRAQRQAEGKGGVGDVGLELADGFGGERRRLGASSGRGSRKSMPVISSPSHCTPRQKPGAATMA
jgi:hypothetical protein